ncbi:hypothetical protein F441_04782 [Phytophthora nicotianae CJ01A1]|uniref:Uncharacterized protein n=4 Tax=Phytophthora nicotianae TaxID=4792 RepID=W2QIQ2_PHYN3|nr:hypothetical protein PPTG_22453 [Phytophthora nicotianae INRA-310]ETI51979.1 hypothetical protein F443_04778 [Phytophthora nicotianae P1569]ETM51571.1 hypothetical protein L914_04615 [Phytophthora nicotianae]ETN12140.1 hypothetical protein PPTG_22453 [Phytophthora nicotianae INRA-310]ETP21765.1 hypothetical protein F441_04782 [Phytophthora nicotianae CJ01A1]
MHVAIALPGSLQGKQRDCSLRHGSSRFSRGRGRSRCPRSLGLHCPLTQRATSCSTSIALPSAIGKPRVSQSRLLMSALLTASTSGGKAQKFRDFRHLFGRRWKVGGDRVRLRAKANTPLRSGTGCRLQHTDDASFLTRCSAHGGRKRQVCGVKKATLNL